MVKLLTLNVQYWAGKDGLFAGNRVADALSSDFSDVEVFCLQEVLYSCPLLRDGDPVPFGNPHLPQYPVQYINTPYVYMCGLDMSTKDRFKASLRQCMGLPTNTAFAVLTELGQVVCSQDVYKPQACQLLLLRIDSPVLPWGEEYPAEPSSFLHALSQQLGTPFVAFSGTSSPGFGNAVLSKIPFETIKAFPLIGALQTPWAMRTALCIKLNDPASERRAFWLVNTHLDHLCESERMIQVQQLLDYMADQGLSRYENLFLVGDLNALVRADYSDHQWRKITESRKASTLEPPSDKVMCFLQKSGFSDVFWAAPVPLRSGFVPSTCSHNVRVDYILCSEPLYSCCTGTLIRDMGNITDHCVVTADVNLALQPL